MLHRLPLLAALAAGCELLSGPRGPAGDDGLAGTDGAACWDLNANGVGDPDSEDLDGDGDVDLLDCRGPAGIGEDGEDGEDWAPADYVGVDTCAVCHDAQTQAWLRSGHAWAMSSTDGGAPTEPWAGYGTFGSYSAEPPPGLAWDGIAWVVGGWAWKEAFVDAEGWVVTGSQAAWSLAGQAWIANEEQVPRGSQPFDCVTCHATGYRPWGGKLPGVEGSWAGDGVQCEACHGPGSQHAMDPWDVRMIVDRSPEACGECHVRGEAETIEAHDGFLADRQQWSEQFHSEKHVMDCVDCHQPHQSAHHVEATWNPDQGIRVTCETCHWEEAATQGSDIMSWYVGCLDCHMPRASFSASAEDAYRADVRTHLFAINPDPDAPQFSEDGGTASPWLGIGFACLGCHGEDGAWMPYSDATLEAEADGYHE